MRFHLAAALVGMLLASTPSAAQPVLVVEHVTLVDPTAAVPLQPATIVIRDGRIDSLTLPSASPPSERARVRVVDGRGKFAVAGLWDMHAHLAALTPIGRAPERLVGHGVLHARDMGGFLDQLLPLRDDIRAGRRVGPALVIAGPTLNGEQFADFHRKVTTEAEARAAVRELKARGVDFIKVHRAIGREAFEAVVDEARTAGLSVSGHVPLVMTWVEAARAGLRTIEHIQTVFENLQPNLQLTPARFTALADGLDGSAGDAIFSALKAQGTYFDPTLVGYEATIDSTKPEAAAARRQAYARMKSIAAKAARHGVPIITGTDVLARHGAVLLEELERLVEIGMTPREVLTAATVTSATAAGRPESGHLRVGGPASFLLVDANPLDDIRALRQLSAVVLQGRYLDAEAVAALRQ